MAMAMNGKTPAVVVLKDQNIVSLYNDAVKYEPESMELREDESGDVLYTAAAPPQNRRCLLYEISSVGKAVDPVRFVPVVPNSDFSGDSMTPLYEIINPQIQYVLLSGMAVMTFWTNFTEEVTEYNVLKVKMFDQDNLDDAVSDNEDYYRALCTTTIYFKKYYVSGGAIGMADGSDPADSDLAGSEDDDITGGFKGFDIVPIATKPTIIHLYKDDYPIVDFGTGSGGDGSGGGFRRHDHANNSLYSGGFSFACFHPGSGTPKKPWENYTSA